VNSPVHLIESPVADVLASYFALDPANRLRVAEQIFDALPDEARADLVKSSRRGRADDDEAVALALHTLAIECTTANRPKEIRRRLRRYRASAWEFESARDKPHDPKNTAAHCFLRLREIPSERTIRRILVTISTGSQ
jgi:hypothetical protein